MPTPNRKRAAHDLLLEAATGIDAIVERAGVAKKSLYNNFKSKADLVAAYLQTRHAEHAYERGFRGCGLLNAAAEWPAGDVGRAAVRANKEEVEAKRMATALPENA